METAISTRDNGNNGRAVIAQKFTPKEVETIKNTIAQGVTDDELNLFVHVCQSTGLNPFAKQIYAISRYNGRLGREVMTIQTSIDGFRIIAERSSKYRGQTTPIYFDQDGNTFEVWLKSTPPVACKIGVLRSDFDEPLFVVALWKSYVQTGRDGNPAGLWAKMPEVMLAKVAEALALRKAFPADMSGLYTTDEMAQADNVAVEDNYQGKEFDKMRGHVDQDDTPKPKAGNLATDKQRAFIEKLAKSSHLTPDEITNLEKALKREKLTSSQASDLIERAKAVIDERRAREDEIDQGEETPSYPAEDPDQTEPGSQPVDEVEVIDDGVREAFRYHEALVSGIMKKWGYDRDKAREYADKYASKNYKQSSYRGLTDDESEELLQAVLDDQLLPF